MTGWLKAFAGRENLRQAAEGTDFPVQLARPREGPTPATRVWRQLAGRPIVI